MAAVNSTMLPLGTSAPAFNLLDTVSGNNISNSDYEGKALLVMFICTHCPFVIHVNEELSKLGKDYADKDIAIIAIGSNDAENYPADGPDKLKEQAASEGFNFPYLYDETQEVAKAYTAACTPDFFLFDSNHALAYRGQLDASRPNNGAPVTGADLRAAMDAVLGNAEVLAEQFPSIGCNIKWKAGNEPSYFA